MTFELRFSHKYFKMPTNRDGSVVSEAILLDVFFQHRRELDQTFIAYDTEYDNGSYPLPNAELCILLLLSKTDDNQFHVWTTMRSKIGQGGRDKTQYFKQHIGDTAKIVVELI